MSEPIKTVVVHDGTFHAHDVFVAAIAKLAGYSVVRTRDLEKIKDLLSQGALVYDVGGNLAPTTDHHNWNGFNSNLESMFPMRLLDQKMMSVTLLMLLFDICRIDCGEEGTDLVSSKISGLNPCWNEPLDNYSEEMAFNLATDLAVHHLLAPGVFILSKQREEIRAKSKEQAYEIVDKAHAVAVLDNKDYLVFDYFVPWQEHLLELDEVAQLINFITYPEKGHDSHWRVQAVPLEADSFKLRKEVTAVAGEDGCYFVHPNKFIAGFETQDQAIAWLEKEKP